MTTFSLLPNNEYSYVGNIDESLAWRNLCKARQLKLLNKSGPGKVGPDRISATLSTLTIPEKQKVVEMLSNKFPSAGFKLVNGKVSYLCHDTNSYKVLNTFNLHSECKSCQAAKDIRIINGIISTLNQIND